MPVLLSEATLVANAVKVTSCHCEEFDDVAIGDQVGKTRRVGQHGPCRSRRCPYRVVEYCHVVELLAMTKGRALLPPCSLQSVNDIYSQYT